VGAFSKACDMQGRALHMKKHGSINYRVCFFGLQQRQNPRFYRGNKKALVKIKRGEQWQATKT